VGVRERTLAARGMGGGRADVFAYSRKGSNQKKKGLRTFKKIKRGWPSLKRKKREGKNSTGRGASLVYAFL